MPAQKAKSNIITFVLVIYTLLCLSYSVLVHDGAYSLQLSGNNTSVEKILREADALFQQRKYDDAIKKYEEANSIKETGEAYKGIGSLYYRMAKEANENKTLSYTVREMKKENYLKSAIKYLSKALSFQPEDIEIESLLKSTNDLYYNTFSKMPPVKSADAEDNDLYGLINEGDSLYTAERYDDAIERYKIANAVKETLPAYKGLGLCFIQKAREIEKQMPTPIRASRKNTYFQNSIKCFGKAGNFDVSNIEIRYLLADVFMFSDQREYYELAEILLKQVISADREYEDAMIKLSYVYKKLGKYDKSRDILNEYLSMKRVDSRALYQMSKLALEENKIEEAAGFLLQSLDNLTDSTAIAEILEDLELIFSDRDKEEFRLAEHKGKFLKKFWLEKDPEPETENNERLTEHLRRVKYAYDNFVTQSMHGKYDDRGKTYIKYGEPDMKHMSMGLDVLPPDAKVKIDPMDMGAYSNESWIYYWGVRDYNKGFYYDFVNKGGKGYELVGDLREANYDIASIGGLSTDERYYALFKSREHLDYSTYGRVAHAYEKGGHERMYDEILNFRDEKIIMEKNSPAEVFLYHDKNLPISLMASSASFRGQNGKIRHELYYSFPVEELKFKEVNDTREGNLDEIVTLKNIESQNIIQSTRNVKLIYDKKAKMKQNFYISQVNLEIPYQDQDCICFLKLKSNTDKRLGLLYCEMSNKNYNEHSLMLSDIEFAYSIEPAIEKTIFTKNGMNVIPFTGGAIDKNKNIFIYFEIYNLMLDSKHSGSYKVEYSVQKRKPDNVHKQKYYDVLGKEVINRKVKDTEFIKSTLVENVNSKDTFTWQSIDMSGLSEGLYDLSIQITDLISNTKTSSEYPFILGGK